MHEALLHALQDQRSTLLARWERLLRAHPSPNALGNPDVLVLMMDWTLEEWASTLRRPNARRRRSIGIGASAARSEPCPCGMNPLLGYFRSAEAAMNEALTALAPPSGCDASSFAEWALARDAFATEALRALRQEAEREISTFCAVCRQRNRFAPSEACPATTAGSVGASPLAAPLFS